MDGWVDGWVDGEVYVCMLGMYVCVYVYVDGWVGGFFLGPPAAFFISVAVSFMEMFSVSDTGLIGFIMNVVSTCSFACTASLIYRKVHNFKGVFAGLLCGSILMVTVMLLWNYYLVPLYMGIPRETSVELLVTAFLPFNVLYIT